jgi:polysaccharide export outer membrane protein
MLKVPALVLAVCVVTTAALSQVRQAPMATEPAPQNSAPTGAAALGDVLTTTTTGARAMLGAGDLLEVSVFDSPELTQRVRVNGEGNIRLSLIGEVLVKGFSTEAVRAEIARRLVAGHFVKDPQVSVFVLEYAGQMVYVTGEVNRPGAYSFLREYRLQDLISVAGGLTGRAGNTATLVRESDPRTSIQIDLTDPDPAKSNPEIAPGDSVTVGLTGIVYVLGNVTRPGGFILDRRTPLTVMQALALAEGPTQTASLTNATLLHTSQPDPQPVAINIKQILKSQQPDLPLRGGDIVWVGDSQTRNFGRLAIQTILATASGVAIYSAYPR